MFLRILKRDLKRKRTMNVILLLFIILATMFVSSGINNVVTVMNGVDYYLDKAGIGDYIIVTTGNSPEDNVEEMLNDAPEVLGYNIENVALGSQDNIFDSNGNTMKSKNVVIFQSIDDAQISFFNMDNEEITTVEKGHVYLSADFMKKNNVNVGDSITVEHNNVNMKLVVDGKAKDALFGSRFIGNTRFILNAEDMKKFVEDENIRSKYMGQIIYINTDNVNKLSSLVSKIPNISFDGKRDVIKMSYVMDMIIAFIVLILSVCLILVSFVVLKFSITFTIVDEFREIGVMKAIGITNKKIRSLYIIKYFVMAILGAIIGFVASIPFGKLLLKSVSNNMVLGNDTGVLINFIGASIVVLIIILFAYLCTSKVNKLSPIDAIRSGQTGERYKKKSIYRIGRSHTSTSLYMAINDVLSSPRRFLTIIVSFLVCTLFVLILVNTTSTMKSSNLIDTFGARSDLYVENVGEAMKSMNTGSKSSMEEYLTEQEDRLTKEGMPSKCYNEIQYKYRVSFEGNDYVLTCQQGLKRKASDYKYIEGVIPQSRNEIAITPQISETIGAKIGDTVTINFGDEKLECIVTAYFQTMNQFGEVIRLHEDAPTDFKYISTVMQLQIDFTDEPSLDEIESRKEKISDLYNNKVMDATEYCVDCIGVVDTMEAVQYLLLAITLIVVIFGNYSYGEIIYCR